MEPVSASDHLGRPLVPSPSTERRGLVGPILAGAAAVLPLAGLVLAIGLGVTGGW